MAHLLNRANRSINRDAVDLLDLTGAESVLEIGFGGGVALKQIRGRTDGLVAGIEISAEMLAAGRRRFAHELATGRMELRRASAERIPYESRRFDRVLTTNTIYFWPDPAAGVREIHRVLGPHGRVVIAVEPAERMRRQAYTRHGFRLYTDEDLERLLTEARFEHIAVHRRGGHVLATAVA